jgi:quercetin dioxygenase-like cupin family protein
MLLLAAAVTLVAGAAQLPAPILHTPDSFTWFSPPGNPALQGAWVLGEEKAAGTYALRVRLAKGGRIALHAHPDTRYSTVLAGTLYVSFGAGADAPMFVVPTGGVYVAPALVPHQLWARDGEVIYQEGGVGPTGNLAVAP